MKTNDKPFYQEFHIEGVKHIAPEDAYNSVINREAIIIDVREEDEINLEYIPLDNVLYHPMSKILDRLGFISKNQHIILVCPGGIRSTKVAHLLNQQGYTNVANLDGGFMVWEAMDFPFQRNENNWTATCGCGCKSTKSNNSCC